MLGIFIGRFSGPLRASVPLVAGIFEMPYWRFQFANFVSAFVWAAMLLLLGDVVSQAVCKLSGNNAGLRNCAARLRCWSRVGIRGPFRPRPGPG